MNTEMHSEPTQISEMQHFAKIVNGFHPLITFARSFILVLRPGADYDLGTLCI